jgi:hypothetical protein
MSAAQTFALCLDCWEFHYGISDSNGVYSRDSGSSNHWDHAVHVFGRPDSYEPPVKTILAALQAGLPISDGRMEMFSLFCALNALQPNNGHKVRGADLLGIPKPSPRREFTEKAVDGLFDIQEVSA